MFSWNIRQKVLDEQACSKGPIQSTCKLRGQIELAREQFEKETQKQAEEAQKHADAEQRRKFVEELNIRLQTEATEETIFQGISALFEEKDESLKEYKPLQSLNQVFETKHGPQHSKTLMEKHIADERLLFDSMKSPRKMSLKNKKSTLFSDKGRSFSCDDAKQELQKNTTHQHRKTFPL